MNLVKTAAATALCAIVTVPAFAQSTAGMIERNANQQERIEQGLRSGDLTVQEAARLEHREAQVERMQSQALRDGRLTPEERARIERAQNGLSRDIHAERHDAERGDPNSPAARRMAADVDRSGNQQRRIAQGVASGQLTNREAARLEHGQARVNRAQAWAGADGHVGRHEQRAIQGAENRQSGRIWREKHDSQQRPNHGIRTARAGQP